MKALPKHNVSQVMWIWVVDMVAIKYKINNNEWVIKSTHSEFEALSAFSVSSDGLAPVDSMMVAILSSPVPITINVNETLHKELGSEIIVSLVDVASPTALCALTLTNTPDTLRNLVQESDCSVVIQRMTTEELQSLRIDDSIPTDIFDWLKQKISTTTNIPEGFDLPVVTDDSITIFSNAFLVVSEISMVDIRDGKSTGHVGNTIAQSRFEMITKVTAYCFSYTGSLKEHFDTNYLPKFEQVINEFFDKMQSEYHGIAYNPDYPRYASLVKNLSKDDFIQIVQEANAKLEAILPESFPKNTVAVDITENTENKVSILFKHSMPYQYSTPYCLFKYEVTQIDVSSERLNSWFSAE